MGEEPGSLPWDPLREQDWNSLGAFDESVLEGVLWEGAGDGVVGKGVGHAGCDGLDIDENGMHSKGVHADQFSPMTIDAQFDCFWDNFPGQGLDTASSHGNLSGHDKQVAEARPQMSHVAGRAGLCGAVSKVTTGADCRADATTPRSPKSSKASARALSTGSVPTHLPVSGAVSHSAASGSFMGMPLKTDFSPGQLVGGEMRHNVSLPAADGSHFTRVNDKDMLVVPFFVIAITEGRLMQTPNQLRATLEQVHRKVSKEQNTVVQVPSEGGVVDLKLRVFAATSSEAGAIDEYIAMHANQVPAPFVVLHKNLYMGVAYDAATLDLSVAIVADRLRKKVKTHAVKILREAIGDARCRISSACLYGQQGAMAPLRYLQFLVDEKMTPLDEVLALPGVPDISRMIIVPTKKPRAPREDMKNMLMLPGSISGFPGTSRQANLTHYASIPNSLHAHINGVAGSAGARGHHSPDASQPSTPGGHVEDDASSLNGDGVPAAARLSAYFPVSLFVTAIADGQITSDAPPKVAERLSLIVRKVPKEQNTSVEISDGTGTVPLQMRVFVVNSEDAKAVGDYINNHITQVPAPFVVLARHLPMAVLYDPATLDLHDASVADRLRKQAKTRAVKVLREAIGNKANGITMKMLRGHEGANAMAARLRDALSGLLQQVDEDPAIGAASGGKYVVFAARNKATGSASVPNSPRKRRGSTCTSPLDMAAYPDENFGADSSTMRGSAGGGYAKSGGWLQAPKTAGARSRGGAATASCLHRNMLDRTLANKRPKKEHVDMTFVEADFV